MAPQKRNEWLDADESDEEDRGYDSQEESRAHMLRQSKRQKVQHSSEDEEEPLEEDNAASEEELDGSDGVRPLRDDEELNFTSAAALETKYPKTIKIVKPKKDRSGVIYLSRVPPFMKPSVLRSLLTPYGPINRLFLTPEPSTSRTQRLKSGGNRRKLYLDGWIEFMQKKDAKFVAENLNAQIIGGKKRGRWHDEVWNIKYLKGVKWDYLVDQIKNENAERAARMRAEISQSTRENKMFLENLERSKMVQGIQSKRKKKFDYVEEDKDHSQQVVGSQRGIVASKEDVGPRRTFKQNAVMLKGDQKAEGGDDVKRVLSRLF